MSNNRIVLGGESNNRIVLGGGETEPTGWADQGHFKIRMVFREVVFSQEERDQLKDTKYSNAEGVRLLLENGDMVAEPF